MANDMLLWLVMAGAVIVAAFVMRRQARQLKLLRDRVAALEDQISGMESRVAVSHASPAGGPLAGLLAPFLEPHAPPSLSEKPPARHKHKEPQAPAPWLTP